MTDSRRDPKDEPVGRDAALASGTLLIGAAVGWTIYMLQIPGTQRLFSGDYVGEEGILLLVTWLLGAPGLATAGVLALDGFRKGRADIYRAWVVAGLAGLLLLAWLVELLTLASNLR